MVADLYGLCYGIFNYITLTCSMISVAEAKKRLLENIPSPGITRLPLAEAAGYVLTEDLYSPLDMPSFPQSAMDGYALHFGSLRAGEPLRISHTIQAGITELPVLKPGEAIRIFTGAPVPEGADTVVMQEKVMVAADTIVVQDQDLMQGGNVRPKASQIAKGALAAGAGVRLGPGSLGFLASLGIAEVPVFSAPGTGIIITGKELVTVGEPLQMGQVYESNSITLRAALSEGGITPQLLMQVDDDPALIFSAIERGLASCKLLLITGGISVGDYDYVHKAFEQAGVEQLFYKVLQKPGKPLYCGRKGDTLVFGLPGNPGSVLSCFYQYVVPAIRQLKGMEPATDRVVYKTLAESFSKKKGLTQFMKARVEGERVSLLQGQESYKMNAFVESNCLVQLDEDKEEFRQGDKVRVYPLSQLWM